MATIIRLRRPTTVWSARFPAPPNSPLPSAVSAAAATTVPAAAALATVCLSTNNQQQQQQQQQPISSFKPKKKMKGKRNPKTFPCPSPRAASKSDTIFQIVCEYEYE